ncbi:MAG TPA: amino acid-binding protein, partial [Bacillota bacterium]|nr:amino acid-binding protein [Bacillota bacterium]
MKLKVTRTDVWAATIDDRPGSLADKLAALTAAGANLEFVTARRTPEKPGKGVVFVTPLKG